MSKVKRIHRSANTGKFVDNQTARENPETTVCETISPAADLIRHVREFVAEGGSDYNWRQVFEADLRRIDDVEA